MRHSRRLGPQKQATRRIQRYVGPPWEGDIGLFCLGSAAVKSEVANFFSVPALFWGHFPEVSVLQGFLACPGETGEGQRWRGHWS